MIKGITLALVLACYSAEPMHAQDFKGPDTVSVQSGNLTLKGLLWRPAGTGSFPTVIFCHGSYGDTDTIRDPVVGTVFARKGYIFLFLFRRGVGLSQGQGVNSTDLMEKAFKEKGQEERNKVQLQQLETDQLQDMIAGLTFLKARKDVDKNHIVVAGVSFGGSLALLLAEHEPGLKTAIIFAPGGYSWDRSPQLRMRLIRAVKNISAPIMVIHAQNDYSINPGHVLDSVMNQLKKPHLVKIYPKFGNSAKEGHNLITLSIVTWEADVFKFLDESLRN
jgi:carboxymethylenebutenolidase